MKSKYFCRSCETTIESASYVSDCPICRAKNLIWIEDGDIMNLWDTFGFIGADDDDCTIPDGNGF